MTHIRSSVGIPFLSLSRRRLVLGFAVPYFTTSETKDVAKVGDLKLQTSESTSHAIPPMAAGGVLILGVVLLGAGFFKKD